MSLSHVGVDHLPGQKGFPVTRYGIHDVSDVVRVVVPVAGWGVDQLVNQDRRASFGKKQERETGRQNLLRFVERAGPEPDARAPDVLEKWMLSQASEQHPR